MASKPILQFEQLKSARPWVQALIALPKHHGTGFGCPMKLLLPAGLLLALLAMLGAGLIRLKYSSGRQLQLQPFVNSGNYIPARQRRKAVRRALYGGSFLD